MKAELDEGIATAETQRCVSTTKWLPARKAGPAPGPEVHTEPGTASADVNFLAPENYFAKFSTFFFVCLFLNIYPALASLRREPWGGH